MQKLKSFAFTRIKNVMGRKLDSLLDGNIYKLEANKDYRSPGSAANALYLRARKLGIKLHIQRVADGMVLQAEREGRGSLLTML